MLRKLWRCWWLSVMVVEEVSRVDGELLCWVWVKVCLCVVRRELCELWTRCWLLYLEGKPEAPRREGLLSLGRLTE
jgi:hypothetical protein